MVFQSSNSVELEGLLREIIRVNGDLKVRITKKEIIEFIRRKLPRNQKKLEAQIVFEGIEKQLSSSVFLDNYFARYNISTEVLSIEVLPSWESMQWAAELRNSRIKDQLREMIYQIPWEQHVNLIKNIFDRLTWIRDFKITKRSRDDGIDFEARYISESIPVTPIRGQAKHWSQKVGGPVIRDFIGSLHLHANGKSIFGIFVSTRGFTMEAYDYLDRSPFKILAFDADQLVKLMIENRIGVRRVSMEGTDLDRSFWDEIENS